MLPGRGIDSANDKHWAPDAFLGLVTGFSVGETLCDSHDRSRKQ